MGLTINGKTPATVNGKVPASINGIAGVPVGPFTFTISGTAHISGGGITPADYTNTTVHATTGTTLTITVGGGDGGGCTDYESPDQPSGGGVSYVAKNNGTSIYVAGGGGGVFDANGNGGTPTNGTGFGAATGGTTTAHGTAAGAGGSGGTFGTSSNGSSSNQAGKCIGYVITSTGNYTVVQGAGGLDEYGGTEGAGADGHVTIVVS